MLREWNDLYFTSRDGLRLHVRHYPVAESPLRPALCLPGLTRNALDFHILAQHLMDPMRHQRDVYCIDYRGRGKSECDPDWRNYSPYIECLDVLDFMTLQGLHDAAIVGTSRGGIIAMIMATMRPTSVGAVVLNDIGPAIERDGLARIIGYVGRIPVPATWDEAGALLREINQRDFPIIDDDEWLDVARQWFNDEGGLPKQGYDSNLAKAITNLDLHSDIPSMWPQFRALSRTPVLSLRGENSDILSSETVRTMADMHSGMQVMNVSGQGHAPLLRDAETVSRISQFLVDCDNGTIDFAQSLSAVA